MLAVLNSSTKDYFFKPANLLIRSVTIRNSILGSIAATRSGIGKMVESMGHICSPVPFVLFCHFLFVVEEIGVVGLLLLLLLLFGVLCPRWIELAGSDDSWEPGNTGHSLGVGVIATGCSGSLGVVSRFLRLVNRPGCVFFLHSCFRRLGGKMMKFWRRFFTVVVVAVGDYRKAASLKGRKRNCSWKLARDERKKIGKNWFRLAFGNEWGDLLLIAIGRLEVIGICLPPHQPDEYGARPFFRWVRAQRRSPDTPGIPKNASGPVGILLKRSASHAKRWT